MEYLSVETAKYPVCEEEISIYWNILMNFVFLKSGKNGKVGWNNILGI